MPKRPAIDLTLAPLSRIRLISKTFAAVNLLPTDPAWRFLARAALLAITIFAFVSAEGLLPLIRAD
jgi:hypothetical protein